MTTLPSIVYWASVASSNSPASGPLANASVRSAAKPSLFRWASRRPGPLEVDVGRVPAGEQVLAGRWSGRGRRPGSSSRRSCRDGPPRTARRRRPRRGSGPRPASPSRCAGRGRWRRSRRRTQPAATSTAPAMRASGARAVDGHRCPPASRASDRPGRTRLPVRSARVMSRASPNTRTRAVRSRAR